MPKELVISAAPHETRVAILEDGLLHEIYIEREKEFALVGSIYKGRVTRVLPGMQSAFVDIGLDSDAFLYVGDFLENLEDYDHVVAPVEGKIEKMEQQGGAVFSPPAGCACVLPPRRLPLRALSRQRGSAHVSAPAFRTRRFSAAASSLHAPAAPVPAPRSPGDRSRPGGPLAQAAPVATAKAMIVADAVAAAVAVADVGVAAAGGGGGDRRPGTRPASFEVRIAAPVHAAAHFSRR